MGTALKVQNNLEKQSVHIIKAISLNLIMLRHTIIWELLSSRKSNEAIKLHKNVISLKPDYAEAHKKSFTFD